MTKRDERNREAGAGQSGKQKYEPPKILSEKVFETTALACMKRSSGECGGGNIKS
jgi:hypothetical protein